MDNTTTTSGNPTSNAPATPFPSSNNSGNGADAKQAVAKASDTADKTIDKVADKASDAAAAAAPMVDRLIQRVTAGAHDAVDSLAAKATSLGGGLSDGVSKVSDTRDEWIESARDVIRQHPFAAVAGALVIGAALLSLNSSRRD